MSLLFALGAGCVTPTPVPRAPLSVTDAALATDLAQVVADAEHRSSLRARASVRIEGPTGSGRIDEIILVRRPASLRLEGLNMLGQTQSLLVTDGERYLFFDGREVQRGLVGPDTLRRVLGLDFAPNEAVEALLVAPFDTETVAPGPSEAWAQGAERSALFHEKLLRLGPGGILLGVQAGSALDGWRWTADYGDWRPVTGGEYPFEIRFSFPGTGVHADLEIEEVELNPSLDLALFHPKLPGAPR